MLKKTHFLHPLKFSLIAAVVAAATGCSTLSSSNNSSNNAAASSQRHVVTINQVSSQGVLGDIGHVYLSDSAQGLKIETQLSNIPTGTHGFHIHEFGSCAPAEKDGKMIAAQSAGGHFNPLKVGHGDEKNGHMGDLPPITADANGNNQTTVYAPRLKLADVKGLALMIHAGGDNHSDQPLPLGGGGARIACGLIN